MNTPLASAAPVSPGWLDAFRAHSREHAFAALGPGVGLLAQSLWQVLPSFATTALLDTTLG